MSHTGRRTLALAVVAIVTAVGALQTAAWWYARPAIRPSLLALRAFVDQAGCWYWVALIPAIRVLVTAAPFRSGGLMRAVPVHAIAATAAALGQASVMHGIPIVLGFRPMPWSERVLNNLDLNIVCYACTVAVVSGVYASRALDVARSEADHAQAVLTSAELEALNAQLQPHFLFNSLNVLAELVHDNPAAARALVADLRGLLAAAFAEGRPPEVALREEIALIQSYLDVQKRRFGDRLCSRMDIEAGTADVQVPRLILQPLVENAVRHGVSARGKGSVVVAASRAGRRLRVAVVDDGEGPQAGVAEGVGIRNVRARLRCLYGADHVFELRRGGRGTEALVEIPWRAQS